MGKSQLQLMLCLLVLCLTSPLLSECHITFRSIRVMEDNQDRFAEKVINRAGCKIDKIVSTVPVSLYRRMDLLERGAIDLIVGVNQRPEREAYAYFSIPVDEERIVLWARAGQQDKFIGKNLDELLAEGHTILGPDSGWYGPEYKRLRESGHKQIILYSDIKKSLSIFHKGRADLILGSEYFEEYFADAYRDKTVRLPLIVHRDKLHFMYSKKTVPEETVKQIDEAIKAELKSSGQ